MFSAKCLNLLNKKNNALLKYANNFRTFKKIKFNKIRHLNKRKGA